MLCDDRAALGRPCRAAFGVGGGTVGRVFSCLVMQAQMFRRVHPFQVFATVVLTIAVLVMNVFIGRQQSSQFSLHHQPMLSDKPSDRVRVRRAVDADVTALGDDPLHQYRPDAARRGRGLDVVPVDEQSRETHIAVSAWNVRRGDRRLLPAATETQPVRRIVGWRLQWWSRDALTGSCRHGVQLVPGNEPVRHALPRSTLEALTAAARADRHMPTILQQIGAV